MVGQKPGLFEITWEADEAGWSNSRGGKTPTDGEKVAVTSAGSMRWLHNPIKGGGKTEKIFVKIDRCASGNHHPGYIQQDEVEVERFNTMTNTFASIVGMVCDGAKPSCAAKIVVGLEAARLGFSLAMEDRVYEPDTGILKNEIEANIRSVSRLASVGMKATDAEILKIMFS